MIDVSNVIIDLMNNDYWEREIADAVKACESEKNYSATILVPHGFDVKKLLDSLYYLVENSVYTVSDIVSYKRNRVSFITGSYIQIEEQQ